MEQGPDPDDWFGEGGGTAPGESGEGASEDWFQDADEPPGRPWREAVDRRVIVVAVVAAALLIAVLAAAGVFSGGGGSNPPAPPAASVTTPTTTAAVTTAPAPALPAPTAPLKPGDTGAEVKTLQRALASLGLTSGTVDGQYGPTTQAAVTRFQRSKGLKADGIAGPATLKALAVALRSAG